MRLNSKITTFFLIATLSLIFILIIISAISFRQFSINTAKSHAQTVAESVRVGLTEMMINGVIDKRENYFNRLAQVEDLLFIRISRSEHVSKQFNQGLHSEVPGDEIDKKVLENGEAYFELEHESTDPVFRATIPFIANSQGVPNCLTCHQVEEGTVLGAITIKIGLSDVKTSAIITISIIAGIIAVFALITLFFFRGLFKPLIDTTEEVQQAVKEATKGNFDLEINKTTKDEIGDLADALNQLFEHLKQGLSHINKSVSQLIEFKQTSEKNSLAVTINMVDSLADAAMFKQSIEEDESKEEVYERLGRVLQKNFNIEEFSIYEVCPTKKNKMVPIMIDGVRSDNCRWCDPEILIRADACRAKRTGHMIDSNDTQHICNAFAISDQSKQHICLPILQSGSVGSVIQLINDSADKEKFQNLVPFLTPYLRESAPVIESKSLMATLKESNLRDAMTGLNNRRFLEEYVDTMVANCLRNNTSMSILMLDLDYFKKVNDTYGHDIGDKVLVELSKVLVKSVRSSDMVIRYGGEEFMIILHNTKEDYGMAIAEKIRVSVEEMKINVGATVLQKTISTGIADFPTDSDTFWQTVKFADVALYQAKENGRNQSVHFTTDMWDDHEEY